MGAASRAGPIQRGDEGMVTVEAAIALCAFIAVLAMALAGVSVVLDQIRCTDAAREAARLVARGEQDRASDAVHQIVSGATMSVDSKGDAITVTVQEPVVGLLPDVRVRADAYAIREPDDPPTTNGR